MASVVALLAIALAVPSPGTGTNNNRNTWGCGLPSLAPPTIDSTNFTFEVPRPIGCWNQCSKDPRMSTLQPSAEWIVRRSSSMPRDSSTSDCCPEHPARLQSTAAGAPGSNELDLDLLHPHDEGVVGHRGSGGLIRGRAVFCLPPGVEWFQGHVAYTTVGGCSASLGVLGTELPVDPVSTARFRARPAGSCVLIH